MALIEGRQPVREALRAGRTIRRVLIADNAQTKGPLGEIIRVAREMKIRVDRLPRAALDERSETRAHQGVMAEADELAVRAWREGLELAEAQRVKPLFVALDGITDPQNLGAILRSAEVFGAHGVVMPKRRSAMVTSAAVKAAAGATEHLIVDIVPNLERTLADMRESGIWVIALAGDAEGAVDACGLLEEPCCLVIGSEGDGVSQLIRARADAVVQIPTYGNVESLNASAAAAVVLWEVARRRELRKY